MPTPKDESEEGFLPVCSLSTEAADRRDHTSTLGNGVSEHSETVNVHLQPGLPAHFTSLPPLSLLPLLSGGGPDTADISSQKQP